MSYKGLVHYFLKKIKRDHIGAYAAQATLYIVMALMPFLLVFLSLLRLTPVSAEMVINGIMIFVPGQLSGWITSIVTEVYQVSTGGVLIMTILSLILALYSAAKAIHSLRYSLNIVYDIEETRNWFVLRFRAMIDTIILILIIVLLLLLLVFGQFLQDQIELYIPFVGNITAIILKFRLIILFFVLILFFTVIYRMLPNRKATFRSQLVGAIGCSAAWYVFSFFISIYVNFFNGFSFYGSLTTLILLFFWLSIAMYIFLVCGEVNSQLEIILKEYKLTKQQKIAREHQTQKNVLHVEPYTLGDIEPMMKIMNDAIEGGDTIPDLMKLSSYNASDHFAIQHYVGVAKIDDVVVGFYELRPNEIGRGAHQANAMYVVAPTQQGRNRIVEALLLDALKQSKILEYKMLVFRRVNYGNDRERIIYRKLGFQMLGRIPKGFKTKDNDYQDINIYHHRV